VRVHQQFDAVVVGAGFSGLYALLRLRERGFRVRVLEAGSGVGGTWYWNRYPGARTDSQSEVYQYWFSDALLNEWDWSERFPAQAETERYLNFVADKFELRKDISFDTRVTSAVYDDAAKRWTLTTENGDAYEARFVVMSTGGLSAPMLPDIPGRDEFAGQSFHTGSWPRTPVDFAGKRVGVIGTAATGIQVIQTIASQVGQLTVFQRTPNYTIPMRNPKYDAAARAALRARYPSLKQRVNETFAGFEFDFGPRALRELAPAEQQAALEALWADGSLGFWVGSFQGVFFEADENEIFSEFVRKKIRARVRDPKVAEKLVPKDYGFGTRRVPLETNYYEAFNRDNVLLVDTRETPIERITPGGVRTSAGEHPLDILIFATGFDAATGALSRIDVRGRDGVSLKKLWAEDIRTCYGMTVHGFPNLFMTMAPLSPAAAFCNVPTCSQQQVDWIADAIQFVRDRGRLAIEASAEAEASWVAHHDEVANATLVTKTKSWYMGTNVSGKPRRLLPYAGGANVYRQRCDEVKAKGYEGFVLT
jgi:acetone monooxygenase